MIETKPDRAESAMDFDENTDGKRTPRAIRFSETEWQRIKIASTRRGISIGGFIRDAALERAAQGPDSEPAGLSSEIEELIKHTFRYAFILTSIKREELIGEGRQRTVDMAVSRARDAQNELFSSQNSPPSP